MVDQIVQVITAEYLAEREAEGRLFEIFDGHLQEKDMASRLHGRIENRLNYLLTHHLETHNLEGHIYPSDTTYVLEGTKKKIEKALLPDISYVAPGRESEEELDDFHYIPPDLAIEIISSSEQPGEIAAKVKTYLQFGVKQVWNVYPTQKQVMVYTAESENPTTYSEGDTIAGGDLLPELALKVADIFRTK